MAIKIRKENKGKGRIITIKRSIVEQLEEKHGSLVGLETKQKLVGNRIIIEVLNEKL